MEPVNDIPVLLADPRCRANLSAVEDALYVVGGKWRMRIVAVLMTGGKRFNELNRMVTGISAKILSAELKELELNALVTRHSIAGAMPATEYTLTSHSQSLIEILRTLGAWGVQHKHYITKGSKA